MTVEPVVFCQRHPDVETALECGRCGTPICPRCMIHTPGGIRCPDCAQLRRPPMYEVGASALATAAVTGMGLGVALGFVGALLFPARGGFRGFFLLLALFVGSGAGALVAEALLRVTRGKRGPMMQGVAVATLVSALLVRGLLSASGLEGFFDLAGLLIAGVGIAAAWGRLR